MSWTIELCNPKKTMECTHLYTLSPPWIERLDTYPAATERSLSSDAIHPLSMSSARGSTEYDLLHSLGVILRNFLIPCELLINEQNAFNALAQLGELTGNNHPLIK